VAIIFCPKCGKPIKNAPSVDNKEWVIYCETCGMAEALKLIKNAEKKE